MHKGQRTWGLNSLCTKVKTRGKAPGSLSFYKSISVPQGVARLGFDELLALHERASRLHQVVHDDYVAPLGGPLLQAHDALVAIPYLGADDLRTSR